MNTFFCMLTRPNIFEYEDYRLFLRDLYLYLKEVQRGFSHRFFSKKAGFASPNMLKLVIDRTRNVTSKTFPKFVRGLKMTPQEADFFSILVNFNQATSEDEKTEAFREMTKNRKFRKIHELSREIFRFYAQWFHIVIREMIDLKNFQSDPGWISQHLHPHVSKEEVKRALKLLLKLKLIKKNREERYLERTDPIIATTPEVNSLAIVHFHQSMMGLASQSLSTVPAEERDITAATLGLRINDLPRIKKKIETFRKNLLAESEAIADKPDRIYQLNIQLFPVTEQTRDIVPKEVP